MTHARALIDVTHHPRLGARSVLLASCLGALACACGGGRVVDPAPADMHASADPAHGDGDTDPAHGDTGGFDKPDAGVVSHPGELDAAVGPLDAGPFAFDAACAALPDAALPTRDPLLEAELATLRARALHDPPTLVEIDALVNGGLPKPPDPRIASAHQRLMGFGHDALTLAFLLATTDDASAAQGYAKKLAAVLDRWVAHGSWFGDVRDVTNYGNVQLELAWFMGNVVRAANIVRALALDGDARVEGAWSEAEHAAFAKWAHDVEHGYLDFPVFKAGLSNRKATQLETMMRIAELDGAAGEARLGSLFAGLADLLVKAIRDAGDIPEDSPRDKYHPQFFLASALQALEIGKRHGLVLRDEVNADLNAIGKLAAAIRYAADENQDDLPPLEYPDIGDPHANREIPFWVLAPRFLREHGFSGDANVDAMVEQNYDPPSRVKLVMNWGFNAIASARAL